MPYDPDQQQNPWGRKQGPQPPDIDELVRRLQERLSSLFGGKGSGKGNGPNISLAILPVLLGVILLLWLASGLYVVAADEQAVVLRFGKHVNTQGPGLNWHLPYPLESVETLPVTRVQRTEIGFRQMGEGRIRRIPQESLMLTKDENIVDISFIVQYKIKDAAEYLFNISNGAKTVRDVAESSIREVIGRTLIDDVLTVKKAEVEVETQELIQSILDEYKAGISVSTVKLHDVQPPSRVIKEFKDVASAREDRERAKNEAQAYANDIIPKARGESKKMVLDADAYRLEIIDRSKGEADRFSSVLNAYRQAPEVTRKRLYLETMQEVLAGTDKIVIDAALADRILPYLPLDRKSTKVEVK
ncbi:MAG: FtsH protease activity modulator HflK [Mariprofundus sp.]